MKPPHSHRVWALTAGLSLMLSSIAGANEYKIAFVLSDGIYVMNHRGSDVRRLTDDKMAVLADSAWSPNGQRIMFFAFRKDDADLGQKYDLPFHFPMYAMNADGSNQKRLLDVPLLPDAKWSPNGMSILFSSAYEASSSKDPESAVYLLDLATGKHRRLTQLPDASDASWSPDGTQVVFSARSKETREIYVMNADGTNQKQLTNLGMAAVSPVWSPDARSIAFVASGWFTMDANGANQRHVSRLAALKVEWAPDSKHLLVVGEGGAYVCEADGANGKGIAAGHGRLIDAVFSPDGRSVILRSHAGANDKIYISSADGSDLRTLNENVGESTLFAVSPVPR
ncbi:MAG TPA: DPP IV N-terminal domain-containing protein [Thermoanaerobaculia bacterium]|nr:DPP IV N-terminal domain-containing protein [Thermoanaerobaculia bacterium]